MAVHEKKPLEAIDGSHRALAERTAKIGLVVFHEIDGCITCFVEAREQVFARFPPAVWPHLFGGSEFLRPVGYTQNYEWVSDPKRLFAFRRRSLHHLIGDHAEQSLLDHRNMLRDLGDGPT